MAILNNQGGIFIGGNNSGNNTVNNYGPPVRLLTVQRAESLISALREIGTHRIDVCGQANGSDDIMTFGHQFAQVFHQAGWDVHGVNTVMGFAPVQGIAVLVRDRNAPPTFARRVLATLTANGVNAHMADFDSSLPEERVVLYVGNR